MTLYETHKNDWSKEPQFVNLRDFAKAQIDVIGGVGQDEEYYDQEDGEDVGVEEYYDQEDGEAEEGDTGAAQESA